MVPSADTESGAHDRWFERAAVAKREGRRTEFKHRFDTSSRGEWVEIVKDLAAMANSGGGVLVFGVANDGTASMADLAGVRALDPAEVSDQVRKYTSSNFDGFEIREVKRRGGPAVAIAVGRCTGAPLVFTNVGTYEVPGGKGKQKNAFSIGTVYVRHGAKSEPATSEDLREFIERELEEVRAAWLNGVRRVVEAPRGSELAVIRRGGSAGGKQTVQITDDPDAPVYGRLSPDDTHPYRQKELLRAVNARLPKGVRVNSWDLRCVKRLHGINPDDAPDFCHKPRYGSPQYSTSFEEWLVSQQDADKKFFVKARRAMQR